MRIIETGARTVLMNRLQCMRDVNSVIDDKLDDLFQSRADCCGYTISSSSDSNSGSSSSGSSSSGVETFYRITENNNVRITENNENRIIEN